VQGRVNVKFNKRTVRFETANVRAEAKKRKPNVVLGGAKNGCYGKKQKMEQEKVQG